MSVQILVHENNRPPFQRGWHHGINYQSAIVKYLHGTPVTGVGTDFLKRFVGVTEDEGDVGWKSTLALSDGFAATRTFR